MSEQSDSHVVEITFPEDVQSQVESLVRAHKGSLTRPIRAEEAASAPNFPTGLEIIVGFKIATAVFGTGAAAISFYREYRKTFGGKADAKQVNPASEDNGSTKA